MCATFCGLLIALLMFLFHNKNMNCAKPIVVRLSTGIRSMNSIMTSNDNGSCDNELAQGWYRFETPYGNRMPEQPASPGMCNTMVPFWFYGRHPPQPSMPMPAVACGADETDSCSYYANIRVQHCGTYMAYYLQPLPRCFMAYCIGERLSRRRYRNASDIFAHLRNMTTEMSTGATSPDANEDR
ncbi:uromodulin [Rhipicephalus sanguineus]|nr:uromodulin [Rhipicephalus sanguineus]